MDINLTDIQLDALREIGNIGAGNAATALSQMINKKVDMTVPQVDILTFDEMINRIGSEDDLVIAVMLKVFGDAPGNILFVLNEESAEKLSKILLTGYEAVSEEIYFSLYQEIGNILGNSYLNSLAMFTGINLVSSVPAVAYDMLAAILSSTFIDAEQYSDYILAIDTKFVEDDNEPGGNFFFIPKPGSLQTILNKLGL
ncbi:CheY-P phosphatase CheC [Caloramator mitchellensis]|uniref:CheY-P phosphatase CheC n=1 Tax=Caloramator mitchellensis TaxID=908809 RepID=A0A0R3JYH2_CALMK|nr:chemotaxis protein CheC [Caloramator mitchellensis]KRQ85996.1 CheY-P phosphatase CheC [Caloramator mitchellensis]